MSAKGRSTEDATAAQRSPGRLTWPLSVSTVVLMLLASGSVGANSPGTILMAQDTRGAADDLSKDIQDLQQQIDSMTEADRAKRTSRALVADLLKQADAQVQAGNLAGAERLLDQASGSVQGDDTVTRNRVALAQATLKIRLGDIAGATDLLDSIARSGTQTDAERARIETLKSRIAAATTDAGRRAAIVEISTLADQAAIRRARDEVTRDPGNLGARLILGDLLRQAGQFDEAERTGEALLADTAAPADAGVRQRTLVLLGRIASDRGDVAAARGRLDELKASPDTPAKATRVTDLEARISRQEQRAASDAAEAARRAAVQDISGLMGEEAINRARQEVARDPQNLDARLLLGDLLRRAGQFEEASQIAEGMATDAAAAGDAGLRQRALVLLGRTAADGGDFAAARSAAERLRETAETPQKAARVADLDARITRQEQRAAQDAAEAVQRATLAEIAGLPASEAVQRARDEVARNPQNADARLLLGDVLRRTGEFEEATQIAEGLATDAAAANDPGLGQRALVLLGRTAADGGDFAAARLAAERLRQTAETPQKAARVADLDARIARQQERAAQEAADAAQRATLAEIAGLPADEGIERARQEVARAPQNASARLLLGDLLRRSGQFEEAGQIAEALAADPAAATDPDALQRALVLLGRAAADDGNFAAARAALDRLRATPETPQKATRATDLEARIARQEERAAKDAARAARRAALDEISTLPSGQAIARARAEVAGDPEDFDARLLLGDLLRRAEQFAEASEVGETIVADAVALEDAGAQQRALVLVGRIDIDRGDFSAARRVVERLAATAETPQRAQRVADLDQRIAREQTRAAERAQKARERAEKERIAAENARIDAALAEINALPPAEALERSRAFYAANADNPRVANAHARLLTRAWEWQEAEEVYLRMIGPPDSITDATLVDNNGAVLGLVDLYNRTNRLALANEWLGRLDAAYPSGSAPPRVATLQARIDGELRPDQFSGSLTVSAGYNSNVSAPDDNFFDDNETESLLPDEGSSFVGADLRLRYDRVISPNGDRLRLQARLEGRPYLELDGVDRASYDINGGYVYNVPGTRAEIQALVGFKSRYIDYASYRRTLYGLFDYSTDINPLLSTGASLRIEANDDDEPDLDGWAIEGNGRFTYDLTPRTIVGMRLNGRYEDAQTAADSRGIVGVTFSIRQEFDVGSIPDFYAFASYNPYFTRYGGPITSGVDTGVVREDFTQKVAVAVGRNVSPLWRMELGGNYSIRSSNVEGKDDNGVEVKFSVTRLFSGGSAVESDDEVAQPRVSQPGAFFWR